MPVHLKCCIRRLQTTLLDVLADRKTGGHIEGDIRVNGHKKVADTFARVSGYGERPLQIRGNPSVDRHGHALRYLISAVQHNQWCSRSLH
jgi:hypothetical protein